MSRAGSGPLVRKRDRLRSRRMEEHRQGEKRSLILSGTPMKPWPQDINPLEECRNLIRALATRNETLYRECRHDRKKATHIRAMGMTLAALTARVNKLDHDTRAMNTPEIFEDARGLPSNHSGPVILIDSATNNRGK